MSTNDETMVEPNCPICMKKYSSTRMAECTKCYKWIHYACAGVGDEVAADDKWKCAICSKQASTTATVITKAPTNNSNQSEKVREQLRLLEEKDGILMERQAINSKRQELLERLSASGTASVGSIGKDDAAQQENIQQNKFVDQPCGKSVLNKYLNDLPQQRCRQISAKPVPLYETNILDDPIQLTQQQMATRHVVPRELPAFSGHPSEWPVFISTFNQTTVACGFTKSENLLRLQRCLKGKAREVIEAQLTIPNCVPIIISTLRRYFGQPEIIMEHYIDRIKKMNSPKLEKMESVLDYAVAVTNLCATLEQADLQEYMRDPSLMRNLVEKLPPTLQLSWASHRRTEEDFNNICVLGDWLHSLAGDICDIMPTKRWFHPKDVSTKSKNKNEHMHVHEDAQTKRQRANSHSNKKCQVCEGNCKTNTTCSRFIEWNVNQRWDFVKAAKLCRQCLKRHPYKCTAPVICSQAGCNGRHHPLLHNIRQEPQHAITTNEEVMNHITCTSVNFRILPVILTHKEKKVQTYAFLDEGSSSTLLNEKLAKELHLDGESAPLCLKWSGTISRQERQSQRVSLNISGVQLNAPSFNISNVRTVQSLNLPVQSLDYQTMARRFPHLKGLPVKSYENATPGILIGLKNWHVAVPLKIREATEEDPIAVKCRLGWTVFSVTTGGPEEASDFEQHCHICECQPDVELHQLVKEFFSVDSLGVSGAKDSKTIQEEERAKSILNEKTVLQKGRYESGLLWRYENIKLPDSKPMALSRMRCLEKRLDKEKDLKENLTRQIRDYEKKGYIRKLTPEELQEHQARVWYLPIFPVRNPNKPDKIRIVWDAAAMVNGVSLNTLLMKGVDWNSSLLGVLLRSRERKVGLSADIKEMYHQISVPKEDQHVLRFLWRDDTNSQFQTYVMQVMTFGATCSPSCAQFVKNHNALQFKEEYPRAVHSIIKNHYVDDLLDSVDGEEEAVQLAQQISTIHSKAGFEIRNWRSNSFNVMKVLNPESDNEPKDLSLNPECVSEKILGMWWCLQSDEYTFSLRYNKGSKKVLSGECRPTKREVLRILMSIYDPLGLIANFLVYLKIVLQDIWRSQIQWDEQINDSQWEAWTKWLNLLPQVENLRIPRCFLNQLSDWINVNVQLHIFVDASEQACATVAYLRISKDDKIDCSLVGAKTKVAPIKIRSIPRLELDAAVMGCRFATQVLDEISIKVSKTLFWCDSKTVLGWIENNPHRYNKYIAFRVAEIQDNQNPSSWRYIPTKQNIADEATKWVKPPKLDISDRWFQGPEFLKYEEDKWPKDAKTIIDTTEELLNVHIQQQQPLIDAGRFSNWNRILRTMAYVIRYLNIRCKFKPKLPTRGILNGDELKEAETVLFRVAQRDVYRQEVDSLMEKQPNGEASNLLRPTVQRSSTIRRLCPYLDDQQLLRVKGRLEAVTFMDFDHKHPVILPAGHHITNLLILHWHAKFLHSNNETIINQLRQKYSIPKLRCAVRSTIKKYCQWCKIKKVKPAEPEMAQLPRARVSPYCNPFTFTGVDYFGPLNVAIGRRQEKRWGVLFTCLTTRAVHIEIAHGLDADSFILCFHDFIQRRGQPKEIYSDRGTNFVGAERQLRQDLEAIDPAIIANHFVAPSLKWVFNPPASPHMGGAWERLVRSFKSALYKSLPTRTPSDPLLRSCLIAAENMINTRPLTYIPLEDESSEALTPNHFLRLNAEGGKPTMQLNDSVKILKHTYQCKERFANNCWKRFIEEYLPELTLRSKWYEPVPPLKIDDIVVIIDKNLPRNNYPKGRIIAVKTSSDGQVRSATIQTSEGIFDRPAVKLALLQVHSNGTSTS